MTPEKIFQTQGVPSWSWSSLPVNPATDGSVLSFCREHECSCRPPGLRWRSPVCWVRDWSLLLPSNAVLWLQSCPVFLNPAEKCSVRLFTNNLSLKRGNIYVIIFLCCFCIRTAKSTKCSFPMRTCWLPSTPFSLHSMVMVKIAWERELCSFMFVAPTDPKHKHYQWLDT